jgi:hypothetical protein
LVLAQAALEALGWCRLTLDRGSLSGDGFQRLNASDQIRLLLGDLRIPLQVPDSLTDASRLCKEFSWDVPELIAQCRNSIIHPVHKKVDRLTPLIPVCSRLAVYYVELTLLALAAYNGLHNCAWRDSAGTESAPVPWATDGQSVGKAGS